MNSLAPQTPVLLASGSAYRRELLGRLLPSFDWCAPDVDERRMPDEPPAMLAARLARLKADAGMALKGPGMIVIGSDQVAALGDQVLGKPGNARNAMAQLLACSGRAVRFYTAVCVIAAAGEPVETHTDLTTVRFRSLDEDLISGYLERDQPFDCAGSFKAERLGVMLMESMENQDPTAIQGLPLIWLAGCLRRMGVSLI